ncbi:MAG: magnesium transporter, partial [Pseudomonadota bacterium]
MAEQSEGARTTDDTDVVTNELMRNIEGALEDGQTADVQALVDGFQPADVADVLEALDDDSRVPFITALGQGFNYDAFSELDESVRDDLTEQLPNSFLAKAISELDSDDAAYVLDGLDDDDRDDVLKQVPIGDRAALMRNLEYPEETAGRIMQADLVAVPPFWTVGKVIDHARETDDLPDTFSEVYVVDPTFRVLGSIGLSQLLRNKRDVLVSDLMDTD